MAKRKSKEDFNSKLADLEALVETLEDSDTSLEVSMQAFEEGMKLARSARKMLEEAEQKVMLLTEDEALELSDYEGGEPE